MLHFLFSFKGRVNRAKFWAFYLGGTFVASAVIIVLIALEQTLSSAAPLGFLIGTHPQTPVGWASELAVAVVYLLFIYVIIAMVVKRLHDRGKSAWWLVFFYGAPLVFFGVAFFLGWPPHNDFPGQPIVMGVAFLACWLICVWYMVELLFLPGTRGANRFGPDPRVKPERIDRPQGGA